MSDEKTFSLYREDDTITTFTYSSSCYITILNSEKQFLYILKSIGDTTYRSSLLGMKYSFKKISSGTMSLGCFDTTLEMEARHGRICVKFMTFPFITNERALDDIFKDAFLKLKIKKLFRRGLTDEKSTLRNLVRNKLYDKHLAKLIFSFVE